VIYVLQRRRSLLCLVSEVDGKQIVIDITIFIVIIFRFATRRRGSNSDRQTLDFLVV